MPKSRKKQRKKSDASGSGHIPYGGTAGKSVKRLNIAIAVLAVLAVSAGAAYWFLGISGERSFQTLVEQGQGALDQVVSHPSAGHRSVIPATGGR